jgi:hypothetical protein
MAEGYDTARWEPNSPSEESIRAVSSDKSFQFGPVSPSQERTANCPKGLDPTFNDADLALSGASLGNRTPAICFDCGRFVGILLLTDHFVVDLAADPGTCHSPAI